MFDCIAFGTTKAADSDQDSAIAQIVKLIEDAGLGNSRRRRQGRGEMAVLGKAGTGKTHVLATVAAMLEGEGFRNVATEAEKDGDDAPTFAIASPTNKAASVLRKRGVAATTIHKLMYVPLYAPDYEELVAWLRRPEGEPPQLERRDADAVAEIAAVYADTGSMPAALAAVGLRTSDFIVGWRRRDGVIDVALVDEASMIGEDVLKDLRALAKVLILFGDPAQLAPVGSKTMPVVEPGPAIKAHLTQIRRQAAGNPILDLAHLIQEPSATLGDLERAIADFAERDERIALSQRACADTMIASPMLVWTNDTRRRVIGAWRAAHGLPETALGAGEPVMVNGIETRGCAPDARMTLEAAGLVKGATAIHLGPGRKPGFVRLCLPDLDGKTVQVSAILEFETSRDGKREIGASARGGVILSPCCATTIHRSQGSQFPTVQVYGPDIQAAARSGKIESGTPLWKRLAYVAITRAQERLVWVTSPKMTRPRVSLAETVQPAQMAA